MVAPALKTLFIEYAILPDRMDWRDGGEIASRISTSSFHGKIAVVIEKPPQDSAQLTRNAPFVRACSPYRRFFQLPHLQERHQKRQRGLRA